MELSLQNVQLIVLLIRSFSTKNKVTVPNFPPPRNTISCNDRKRYQEDSGSQTETGSLGVKEVAVLISGPNQVLVKVKIVGFVC